ncbi:MAG TPA: hypothetical protein VIL23_03280 [Clostridia bacterium]
MIEQDNKRGIKTVLRKLIKGKNMAQTANSVVVKKGPGVAIMDAQDEIPFAWKGNIFAPKKGKKSTYRLIKKIIAQITPKSSKKD